jgi:hypothetical protein
MHVLSSCPVALTNGKYKWRHDEVLRLIYNFLRKYKPNYVDIYSDLNGTPYGKFSSITGGSIRRPDIFLLEEKTQSLAMLELSCPDDENVHSRHIQKAKKYESEQQDASVNKWNSIVRAFEVSTRGFHNGSLRTAIHDTARHMKFVLPSNWKRLVDDLLLKTSRTCLHGSYIIWLTRANANFSVPPALSNAVDS